MIFSSLERRVTRSCARDEHVTPVTHLMWFCDGALLFFAVAWIGSSLLSLDNDFYYAIYIWTALTFLYGYLQLTGTDPRARLRTGLGSSMVVGVGAVAYAVIVVVRAPDTARPGGVLLAFEVLWRGVAYGIVHGLVLFGFPAAVASGLFGGAVSGIRRRVAVGLATLVLIWVMTASYHLGFEQFRDGDLAGPQRTATAISVPTLVTMNPVGSVVAQTTLHVVATVRTYESNVFAPPHVEFVPEYTPPGVFGPQ